jgi:hypothetical protein
MTATACNAAYNAVIARYVTIVRGNGTVDAVLEALTDGEESVDIIHELLDVTWEMGLRSRDESDTTADAWWDAACSMLPKIAEMLR